MADRRDAPAARALAEDENRAAAWLSDSRLVDDELEGRWRVYLRRWGPEARRWQMVLGGPT